MQNILVVLLVLLLSEPVHLVFLQLLDKLVLELLLGRDGAPLALDAALLVVEAD